MFKRNGHKVRITKGADSGAEGKIIDVDSDVVYVEKTDGTFQEMYGTSNIYGFELAKVEVIDPKLIAKDKVKILSKAYDDTDLPDDIPKDSSGRVVSVVANLCKVKIEGTIYTVDSKFLWITEGVASPVKSYNLQLRLNDVVFFKKAGKSIMARVIDKYSVNYELEDRDGDRHEVKKTDIFKKMSVLEMRKLLIKSDDAVTLKQRQDVLDITKKLSDLRKLDIGRDRDAINYKKRIRNILMNSLKTIQGKSMDLIKLKNCTRQVNSACRTSPSTLKKEYWRLMTDVNYRSKTRGIQPNANILGVQHCKQGNVFTQAGTIKKISDALTSPSIMGVTKVPILKSHHVGVEIECFSDYSRESLNTLFLQAGLGKNISLVNDQSIKRYGEQQPIEVRVIATERSISRVIDKTIEVLAKGNVGVNDSCGLHVHLDMRHRNVKSCYRKLYNAQETLFKASSEERGTNQYCMKLTSSCFQKALERNQHYDCISAQAYSRHKTLEVRMHEGSVDAKQINNWVKILIGVVTSRNVNKNGSADDFVNTLTSVTAEDKDYFKARLTA